MIALILYLAFHEGFGFKLALWNCIPPTLGLILLASANNKTNTPFHHLRGFRDHQRADYVVLRGSLVLYSARH